MGKTVSNSFKGANAHRYEQNPLEKAFAVAWQEANSGMGRSRTMLDYLMDKNNRGEPNPPISNRDWEIANTIIQWLGSPVGEGFIVGVVSGPEGKYFRERLEGELASQQTKSKK